MPPIHGQNSKPRPAGAPVPFAKIHMDTGSMWTAKRSSSISKCQEIHRITEVTASLRNCSLLPVAPGRNRPRADIYCLELPGSFLRSSLLIQSENSSICRWFGAEWKTNPTTCRRYIQFRNSGTFTGSMSKMYLTIPALRFSSIPLL